MDKTIKRVKTWTFIVREFSDGTSELERISEGFFPYELLGLIEHTKQDLLKQLNGEIKPTRVKRKVI